MERFKNKNVLITGGNSGIGYATAKLFKEQGANVIITGRRADAVKEAAAQLGVTGFMANQARVQDIDALAAQVKSRFGHIDVLFINAGISNLFAIADATETGFDEMMDVNFKGAYFTLSRFIPLIADGGSVVFLSSMVAWTYKPHSSVYQAGKAALNSVMKTAAVELAPRKIRVNAVSPGPIKTPIMQKSNLPKEVLVTINDTLADMIPLKRMGETEEVARLVAFIAGEEGAFITGAEFTIDGGLLLA